MSQKIMYFIKIYKVVLTELHEIAADFSQNIYWFFHYLSISFIIWKDLSVDTKNVTKICLYKYSVEKYIVKLRVVLTKSQDMVADFILIS